MARSLIVLTALVGLLFLFGILKYRQDPKEDPREEQSNFPIPPFTVGIDDRFGANFGPFDEALQDYDKFVKKHMNEKDLSNKERDVFFIHINLKDYQLVGHTRGDVDSLGYVEMKFLFKLRDGQPGGVCNMPLFTISLTKTSEDVTEAHHLGTECPKSSAQGDL